MSDANSEALALIEAHFNTLEIGSSVEFDSVFSVSEIKDYANENNLDWPGQYVDQNGQSLVIPGLIFFRPAVGFGLGDPNPPLPNVEFDMFCISIADNPIPYFGSPGDRPYFKRFRLIRH